MDFFLDIISLGYYLSDDTNTKKGFFHQHSIKFSGDSEEKSYVHHMGTGATRGNYI